MKGTSNNQTNQMYKFYTNTLWEPPRPIAKLLLTMKLTTLILIATILQVSARPSFAQKITLSEKSAPLRQVLDKIRVQSGYDFLFTTSILNNAKPVSIQVKDAAIEDVLQKVFAEQPLNYSIDEKTVLVKGRAVKYKGLPSDVLPDSIARANYIDISVSGIVKDSTGASLPGVSVFIKGTNRGTITNADGRYVLNTPVDAILVFTLVGYKTIEQSVSGKSVINITLQENSNTLDAVVVVGYGTSTKRKINSSISTLAMDNVASLPVQSINDGVAGRINGVIVTSSSGAPGSKSTISIRGGGTPLYIIDNQIRSQNDFENLNPSDIESYSVLKDVGATALYGQQGSNGVILVTTKKGKEGKTSINYSFNQIFSQPTIFPKRVSSYETLNAINKVYLAEGKQQPTSEEILALYKDQSQPFLYPNTDWQSIALKDFASEQRHDLSISSGTNLLTYYASGSYYNQGTNLRTDNNYNKRATYRLNTVSNFDAIHLKVTTGIDGYVESNSIPNSSTAGSYAQIFQHIQQQKAQNLAYNEFGLPYNGTTDNPAIELSPLSGYNRNTSRIFNSILNLDYEAPFLKGLHLKTAGSYNMWNSMGKSWNATAPSYALNSNAQILGNPPSLNATRGDGSTMTLQGFVTYNKSFGDHNVDFTGVYERSQNKSNSLYAYRQNYQIIYDQFNAGPSLNADGGGSEYETARAGYVGRLSYNYKSKYLLDGTIRYDGNSAFPKGSQWGTFYSFAGGYIISEEPFMKRLKEKHILDYLKVRGSFGLVGQLGGSAVSSDGTNLYAYVPGYTIDANAWVVDGNSVQGSSEPGSLPSTNFSWFTDRERNLGLDLATLNSRLTSSWDYFYKRTTGYVTSDSRFAQTLGIGLPPINYKEAALRREGMEFNVTWNDKIRDFSYKVGLNFTYFNQLWERTTDEDEAALKNPYTRISGSDQSSLTTGYQTSGFYTSNGELLTGARRISSIGLVAGDLRYIDINGDGKIDGSDFTRIGSNTFPRINYGITIDLDYKGIYLSAVVMGSGSRDRYIGGVVQGGSAQNMLVYGFQQDYWTPENQDALFPRQVSSTGVNGNNNYTSSDFWILKSSFIRLKYLQLGYDLKRHGLKRSSFKQFKVFASGTNLLTSSKSLKYFIDPESNQNNEDYPVQRTVSLGINVGF
jgi:TonB-linked SusC/RagA family outer membrane protein